jgi:hypothetical protein
MADAGAEGRLSGELTSAPSDGLVAVVLAVSGIAFVRGAARVVARLALAYRRPAEVRLSERGLEISYRTEMLGRVLRDRETLIPLSNLSSVTRELKYRRAGLYAGLLAAVVGTYIGSGLLLDGVRVPGGSPSLLGLGLAAIALGVVLDFGLTLLTDTARHTCRVVVVPRHGPKVCIQGLAPEAADRVLAELAKVTAGTSGAEPLAASPELTA